MKRYAGLLVLGLAFRGLFIQSVVADGWEARERAVWTVGLGGMVTRGPIALSVVPVERVRVAESEHWGCSATLRVSWNP